MIADKVILSSGQVFEVSIEFHNSNEYWAQYTQVSGPTVPAVEVWYELHKAEKAIIAKWRKQSKKTGKKAA